MNSRALLTSRTIHLPHLLVLIAGLACHRPVTRDAALPALRVRTDRASYRADDFVIVTTTNRSGRTVYDDHCGGELQGLEFRRSWNGSYGAARDCFWPDPAAWRTSSRAIPPGAVHADTLALNPQAYTGTWRVVLDLRDEKGQLLPEAARTSNTFHALGTWTP